MLRIAAEYADLWNGWLMPGRNYADQVPPLRAAVDAACDGVGRDPATLGRTVGVLIDQRPAEARPAPVATPLTAGEAMALTGSDEEIAAELRRFADEGISHIQIIPALSGVAGIEALAPVLSLLDQDDQS